MKFFFGWNGHKDTLLLLREEQVHRIMVSYAIMRDQAEGPKAQRMALQGLDDMDVMVDSGAFSAWRSGLAVNLGEYCEFLSNIGTAQYMALDVMGDWRTTELNRERMEEDGWHPIPVWHPQDPWELLRDLQRYPVIALGGTVPLSMNQRRSLFTRIWGAYPHAYHGLGVGSVNLLRSYPWYSADASTWDYNAIFWKAQGEPDKWTPRRRTIQRMLRLEQDWHVPLIQLTLDGRTLGEPKGVWVE